MSLYFSALRTTSTDRSAIWDGLYTSATNVWITESLNMGIPQAVSQNVGKFYEAGGDGAEAYQGLIIRITE
jgi:hypothetical protein